jgi:uncharacterized protein (TIGR03067 family)
MLPTLLLVSLFVVADAKQDLQKEKARLRGTWVLTSFEIAGMKIQSEMKLIFTNDKMALVSKNGKPLASSYRINPSKKPATIDVVAPIGPMKGKINPGIYKVEGNSLTLCQGEPGQLRPTAFASKQGSPTILMVFKRAKPR